jgi:NDP-sugar pyrophosphorylase family protein
MAGEGKRFKDAGYSTPKPMIDVGGEPMILRALKSLPKAFKNILIVRRNSINIKEFRSLLEPHFENVIILEIDYLSEGQASTCLLAEDHIDSDSILNIGACDIGFEYNFKKYIKLVNNCDSFIWTYSNNKNVIDYPEMYGWVKLKENSDQIKYVSCKKPISENLLEDQVVSGIFTFKNSSIFFNGIKKMIKRNDRVNGEFYLDTVFNHLSSKSHIFKVDKYYSWGTPNELKNYLNEI